MAIVVVVVVVTEDCLVASTVEPMEWKEAMAEVPVQPDTEAQAEPVAVVVLVVLVVFRMESLEDLVDLVEPAVLDLVVAVANRVAPVPVEHKATQRLQRVTLQN